MVRQIWIWTESNSSPTTPTLTFSAFLRGVNGLSSRESFSSNIKSNTIYLFYNNTHQTWGVGLLIYSHVFKIHPPPPEQKHVTAKGSTFVQAHAQRIIILRHSWMFLIEYSNPMANFGFNIHSVLHLHWLILSTEIRSTANYAQSLWILAAFVTLIEWAHSHKPL